MNDMVKSKLKEVIDLWGIKGEPTQIIEKVPVYFASFLKAEGTFGFQVGEGNVVTIYTDSKGNAFDYTIFFLNEKESGIHAVEVWLRDHYQTGRGYEFMSRFHRDQYVHLSPWGDRTEGELYINYHSNKGWYYAWVSDVNPHFIDESKTLKGLLSEFPEQLDQEAEMPIDPRKVVGVGFDPQQVLQILKGFEGDTSVVEYIALNALQLKRKLLIISNVSHVMFGPCHGTAMTSISIRVSSVDGVTPSEEYATPHLMWNTNPYITYMLLKIASIIIGDEPMEDTGDPIYG